MYSLRIACLEEEVDLLSGTLWDAGTVGVQELEQGSHRVTLIASFETNSQRAILLAQFARYSPQWEQQDAHDWIAESQRAWPGRLVGERFFLAPPWCLEPTPLGRLRLVHNPGLACGTGEHPCTQLALVALENCVEPGHKVVDVGTGSGMLAIAALQLGAAVAVGIDTDEAALQAARENFELNHFPAVLAAGSAECLAEFCADVVVANISASVLLSIADELKRLVTERGWLILTGFHETEVATVQRIFSIGAASASVTSLYEWCCLCLQFAAPAAASDHPLIQAQTSRPPGEIA